MLTRRIMMFGVWLPQASLYCQVALAVVGGIMLPGLARAEQGKPNVLFIVSDDLNFTLSGMGHPECKTPHLDQLAKSSTSFTHAFCQFPLCAPSRASMMTGQYPLANGVAGNGGDVAPDRVTLPRYFAKHGYWTARVSKIYHMGVPIDIVEGNPGRDHIASWHETYNIAALEALTPGLAEDFTNPSAVQRYPEERRKWLEARTGGPPYRFSNVARAQYAVVEVEESNQHLLVDALTTDKAIELLQSRADQPQPFFLAVGLVRPHFPFVATQDAMGQYEAAALATPIVPADDHQDIPDQAISAVRKLDKSSLQKLRRGYYGAVSFMDRQVGRLLSALDRVRLRDNTIIVFVSDHGYLMGEHHMWKKAKLWEEAIRVPMMISAPGYRLAAKCEHVVELVDLYPTLTDLAGLPRESRAQGQSLVRLLDDPRETLAKTDALIQVGAGYGLRGGQWAYMWYPRTKSKQEGFMLYDMNQDPQQYINLADDEGHASLRARLHARLTTRIEAARN